MIKLSEFIPPIIKRLKPNKPLVENVLTEFHDFAEAEKICGSYNDEEISEILSLKTQQLINNRSNWLKTKQEVQNLLVFNTLELSASNHKLNILEIGGACGALYFQLKNYIDSNIDNWIILETPAMANAGKKLFKNHKLNFFSDFSLAVDQMNRKDLIIASGVLQYLPDSLAYIQNLFDLGFEHIYITRFPLAINTVKPILTFQETDLNNHGPGKLLQPKNKIKRVPITYIPENLFFNMITENNYEYLLQFEEDENCTIEFMKGEVIIKYIGLLLKRNKK